MGMAASQARYLGLTARKTNVEYEGQQVNQARTALANQSANLFNQLLTLQVPTPPSTTDFTKIQYSYQDGVNAETIENMVQISDPEYNYNVTHFHYAEVYRGQRNLISNPQVATETIYDPTTGTYVRKPTYVGNSNVELYVSGADKDLDSAYEQIKKDWPDDFAAKISSTNPVWVWKSAGKSYFSLQDDLFASADSAKDPTKPIEDQTVKLPGFFAQNNKEKVLRTEKALVEIDGEGRASSVRYEDSSVVYSLSTETITDDNAYKDAMNKYNYDMATYEKQIQDINAKTEAIQQEDRTLELRLRQLDTEQDALQTEMEAVKKVIEKNIESTFKTFE